MRKTIFTFILMLVAVGFFNIETPAQQKQFTVQINHQKTVVKNKLTVKFLELLEDSRCPKDSACIQAGTARIKIEVRKPNGASKTFELNTTENPQAVSFAGYEIKLIDVNPQPASNIRINRNGYTASFSVTKFPNSK